MRRLFVFLTTLSAVVALAVGTMAAQSSECISLTQQALDASGFNQQIDASTRLLSSDDFLALLLDSGGGTPVEAVDAFRKAIRSQLNAELIKKELLRRFASTCKPESMQQAVERMQTPFVAHMLELETTVYSPAGAERVKRYADALKVAPPTDDRLDAIHDLDESMGMTNFQMESSIRVIGAMLEGFGVSPFTEEDLRKQHRTMQEQTRSGVETSLLLIYRGVPRADLVRYARELRSEPLHGFFLGMRTAFLEVMTARARALAEDLKSSLPAHRS